MRLWGFALLIAVSVRAEEVPEVVLPVASEGTGPRDRVVLTIDSQGRLLHRTRLRSLDELATILDQARQVRTLCAGRKDYPN